MAVQNYYQRIHLIYEARLVREGNDPAIRMGEVMGQLLTKSPLLQKIAHITCPDNCVFSLRVRWKYFSSTGVTAYWNGRRRVISGTCLISTFSKMLAIIV